MLATILIGLYTVRLLVRDMGPDGYGIYTAVVASGSLLGFISSALTSSSQRQLAFELGSERRDRQKSVFNSILFTFFGLAGILGPIGWLIAPFAIDLLTIPVERQNASLTGFLISIANLVVLTLTTPYRAAMLAHQDVWATSVMEFGQRICLLLGVLLLPILPFDPIPSYAFIMLVVSIALAIATVSFSVRVYPETTLLPSIPPRLDLNRVFSFAGWKLSESLAITIREQGCIFATNNIFGPSMNAAFAVASQASAYMSSFATSLAAVIGPAAARLEGQGSQTSAMKVGGVGSRYPTYVGSIIGFPLFVHADLCVSIWLGSDHIDYAAQFLRIFIVLRLTGMLSWGDGLVADAKGRIAILSLSKAILTLLFFAITWIVIGIMQQPSPFALPIVMLATVGILSLVFSPLWVGKMLDRPYTHYLWDVPGRAVVTVLPPFMVAYFVSEQISFEVGSLFTLATIYPLLLLPSIWFMGMEPWEREAWDRIARVAIHRLHKKLWRCNSN